MGAGIWPVVRLQHCDARSYHHHRSISEWLISLVRSEAAQLAVAAETDGFGAIFGVDNVLEVPVRDTEGHLRIVICVPIVGSEQDPAAR
jgi:hypothetical protein